MIDLLSAFTLVLLFLFSFVAYLSFSAVAQDSLLLLSLPMETHRDEASLLAPISDLCANPEQLISILNFCRLFFALPLFLLLYYWTAPIHGAVVAAAILTLIVALHLLPAWIVRKKTVQPFRKIVRGIGYTLYPLFWLLAFSPTRNQEALASAGSAGAEPESIEEESREFKGDILRAISMIEDTTVREVMTPRVEMICIPSSASLEELHQFFKEHKFSRLPVYREKIDNIAGIVNLIDLVSAMPAADSTAQISSVMRPALFVPETKKVFTLLRELRESHAQMAIVIDEYGGTSGLVTLEDLLEEIVGEIEDEYDEAPVEGYREKDGAYIVTGKFSVERMEEILGIEIHAEDFETISGLVFSLVGRIPAVGERIKYHHLNLEILEADKRRIHRIRIREFPKEENAEKPL